MLRRADAIAALVPRGALAGWLLSDLAMDHTCRRCGAMPALALLMQNRAGLPNEDARVELADRFDES